MATLRIEEIYPLLQAAWAEGITMELVSKPGIGKTAVISQWCQHMANKARRPFGMSTSHASTDDPSEVAGLPILDEMEWMGRGVKTASRSYPGCFPKPRTSHLAGGKTHQVFFPQDEAGADVIPGDWVWGVSIPKFGVVFVDEFRQASHDVQKVYARLIDEHTLGNYSLAELGKWGVVLASNSSKHRSGANKDLAFIKNRKQEIEIEFDYQSLIAWMDVTNAHPLAMAYVDAFPGEVAQDLPSEDIPFCTPRSLIRAFRFLERLAGNKDKTKRVLCMTPSATEAVAGLIGQAPATNLMGFLRRVEEMPSYEDIVRAPASCLVPSRLDVTFAVTRMLEDRVELKDAGAVFQYIDRIDSEFRSVLARQLMQNKPELQHDPAVIQWISDNADMIQSAASTL